MPLQANDTRSLLRLSPPLGQLLSNHFDTGVFDLLENLERSLGVRDGFGTVAELVEGQAHVPERVAFAVPVAGFARDL